MLRSSARRTASGLGGAPTPTSTGAPASAAFWTSSKESRPETQSRGGPAAAAVEQRAADDLVHCVVAADVLAHEQRLARGAEQAGRVQAAGAREGRLAQAVGQRGEQRRGRSRGPSETGGACTRPPPARPCRTRRRGGRVERRAPGSRSSGPMTSTVLAARSGGGPASCGPSISPSPCRKPARAPRRDPACASSPRSARRRRGSPAAPRPRPRPRSPDLDGGVGAADADLGHAVTTLGASKRSSRYASACRARSVETLNGRRARVSSTRSTAAARAAVSAPGRRRAAPRGGRRRARAPRASEARQARSRYQRPTSWSAWSIAPVSARRAARRARSVKSVCLRRCSFLGR